MLPLTVSKVKPVSSLGSILDFRSIIANTEAAADCALEESDVKELDCETPIAAIARARKTCTER